MQDFSFSYRWELQSSRSAEELWPLVADTQRLFKELGHHQARPANVSHTLPAGYRELTSEQLHRPEIWLEEPCRWHAPHHFIVKRVYNSGPLRELTCFAQLSKGKKGTLVTLNWSGKSRTLTGRITASWLFNKRAKRRIKRLIQSYDQSLEDKTAPQRSKSYSLLRTHNWQALETDLIERSSQPILARRLISMIRNGDEMNLREIEPRRLAELWNTNTSDILHLLFHASGLKILNFNWKIFCDECNRAVLKRQKLTEITEPLFCSDCKKEVLLDFHHNIRLTFQPHPMVRKISDHIYTGESPSERPEVLFHHLLSPSQLKMIDAELKTGHYRIQGDKTSTSYHLIVSEDAPRHVVLSFSEGSHQRKTIEVAPSAVIRLQNQTQNRLHVECTDLEWDRYHVTASEITSRSEFRNLFPGELIREKQKIATRDLTVLFTDLFNSSEIYNNDGEDSAVGLVISHFDILQEVITEERGAIVKTIGDAVMAVFPKPAAALRAFKRARHIFGNENSKNRSIRLKGGIHRGDAIAVTLNNRIDYFGNTVNIAARLVDFANSDEVVLSAEAYKCPEVKKLLRSNRRQMRTESFTASLKGFDDRTFEARRITFQKSPLRLVI